MNAYSITDACIGCTLCARNCPVRAISGALKERHRIDAEYCVRCGLCGRLCPVGAVLNENGAPSPKLAKGEWLRPAIDHERCAGCSVCVENCPVNALTLSAPAFRGDIRIVAELARPEKCIGCGLCRDACPIGAVTLERQQGGGE